MNRHIALLMVALLLVPALVMAQDVELTQTFEGGDYSFQYPDGWFVSQADVETAPEISNFEPREDMDYDTIEPGEVTIAISPFMGTEEFPIPPDVDAYFLAGYGTGLFAFVVAFNSAFSEETATLVFDTPIELDLENHEAVAVPYTVDDTYAGWIVLTGGNRPFFVTIKSRVGELEEWLNVALAIVDSARIN